MSLDLEELGASVEVPDRLAQDLARQRLLAAGRTGLHGRLNDLALWWAAVRSDDRAAPPHQVRHIGLEIAVPDDMSISDALEWGAHSAEAADRDGVDLLLLTADDPTGARLISAELMGLDAIEACDWPDERGLDDNTWMDQVLALRDGLRRTDSMRGDPTALLHAAGSVKLAAATAFVVQAAACRLPVILDGPGAAAAAQIGRRTAYLANHWWQAAHVGHSPLHERTLKSLNLEPILSLGIQVEDGIAAQLAAGIVQVAAERLVLEDA